MFNYFLAAVMTASVCTVQPVYAANTSNVLANQENQKEQNLKSDGSKSIDTDDIENAYMSEFFEKSLSEIETVLQEKGLKKIVANHDIVIRLTSKQIKQIITELEPYKEELTPKNPEETYEINVKRKKAFIDLLFDKLHLKGVYSYIDPEYQYVSLPWNAEDLFDLDLTTKTADVDGSTVEIPNGYSITITIPDNPEGYGFNNGDSKSLTNYEVGQRMLYVINTYGDKDYYDEVYVPLPSKATRFALGDVDLNDIIDVSDLTELSLALIGDKELTADQQKYSDIDGDGAVTIADLARLQQYLAKKITSF